MIKEDMAQYWTKRVEGFSALRQREFTSEKHARWNVELEKYMPDDRKLNILDIGKGTGFFAFLLAEKGHHVTGIDITPAMVEEAKRLSEVLHLPAEFYVMDAENPDFKEESFDCIVTRKLTWTLPDLRNLYRKIQMVFQLPAGSFDPHMPLGESVGESLLNNGVEKDERKKRVIEMFRECGLSSDFYPKYPHEVSGGECQRAAIARALIVQPEILICDEVTSSLDVTMQKQIMDLLRHLKETNRLSILFISHYPALV